MRNRILRTAIFFIMVGSNGTAFISTADASDEIKILPSSIPPYTLLSTTTKVQTNTMTKTATTATTATTAIKPNRVTSHNTTPEYKSVRHLCDSRHYQQAIQHALSYLNKNPDDGDVRLVLGQCYLQQKKYHLAYKQFQSALIHTPSYTEVRIALIQVLILEHQYTKAQNVLNDGLRMHPNNPDLKKAQIDIYYESGQYYFVQKKYDLARAQFQRILAQKPDYMDARIELINTLILMHQYAEAQKLVNQGFKLQPHNVNLIGTQANLYYERGRFHQAAETVKKAIKLSPDNEIARNVISELNELSPRYMIGPNTVGIYSQNLYASDLHQNWDFSTLYYGRDTNIGYIMAKLNYNSRFNTQATQAEIEAFPILNRYVYFDLDVAYANQPILFPNYLLGAETYISLPNLFDFSFGGKYNRITNSKSFSYYTGSISKQIGNNVFTFRPYYYTPNSGPTTILYTGAYRHYFHSDADNYIDIIAGIGKSPDLDNLLAANFIVMESQFINVGWVFPLCAHTVLVNIGATYNHQFFPSSNLVRNLTGGTVGILKRF